MTRAVLVGGPLDGQTKSLNDTQLDSQRYEYYEYEKPRYDPETGEQYDDNIVKNVTVYKRNTFRIAQYLPELYIWAPSHMHPADLFQRLVNRYVGGDDDEETTG